MVLDCRLINLNLVNRGDQMKAMSVCVCNMIGANVHTDHTQPHTLKDIHTVRYHLLLHKTYCRSHFDSPPNPCTQVGKSHRVAH